MGSASVLNTFTERVNFLGMPKDHLSQVELYRLLPLLFKEKDYLVTAVQKSLEEKLARDRYSLLIYDATNSSCELAKPAEEPSSTMPAEATNSIASSTEEPGIASYSDDSGNDSSADESGIASSAEDGGAQADAMVGIAGA